jgi:hypothetical protein
LGAFQFGGKMQFGAEKTLKMRLEPADLINFLPLYGNLPQN